MDNVIAVVESQEKEMDTYSDKLSIALDKLEDMENRARRGNLRIRDLPEFMEDLTSSHSISPQISAASAHTSSEKQRGSEEKLEPVPPLFSLRSCGCSGRLAPVAMAPCARHGNRGKGVQPGRPWLHPLSSAPEWDKFRLLALDAEQHGVSCPGHLWMMNRKLSGLYFFLFKLSGFPASTKTVRSPAGDERFSEGELDPRSACSGTRVVKEAALVTSYSSKVTMTAAAAPEDGNVSVVVRVRPPNTREEEGNQYPVVQVVDHSILVFDPDEPETLGVFSGLRSLDGNRRKGKDLKFIFDHVFGEQSRQQEVFEHTTKPIIDGVLNGYNCSVFAYGATGAGKTHTMLGSAADPGVMYLTMVELYQRIEAIKEEKSCEVVISYLEVYNEQIQDLLEPKGSLAIREDPQKGVVVQGLSFHQPKSAEQLLQLLANGNLNRTQHPTDANASSSRSHAVFQIYVKQQDRTASISQDMRVAKMCLIDLAGSERASSTNAKGERLREGANINRSLLALINVINALADAKSKKAHIPYRDSKLTRLLKDSIGGNCRTVMIAAISPSSLSYDDTYNTLKYANRAKEIKLSLKSNVINLDCHISKYAAVCEELKSEVAELKAKLCFYENKESTLEQTDYLPLCDSLEQRTSSSVLHSSAHNRRRITRNLLKGGGEQTCSLAVNPRVYPQDSRCWFSPVLESTTPEAPGGGALSLCAPVEQEFPNGMAERALIPSGGTHVGGLGEVFVRSRPRFRSRPTAISGQQVGGKGDHRALLEEESKLASIVSRSKGADSVCNSFEKESGEENSLSMLLASQNKSTDKLISALLCIVQKQYTILKLANLHTSEMDAEIQAVELLAIGSHNTPDMSQDGSCSDKEEKTEVIDTNTSNSLKGEDSQLPSMEATKKRQPIKRCRQEILPDISPTLRSPVIPVKRRRQANTPCKPEEGIPSTPELHVKRPRKSSIPSRPNLRSAVNLFSHKISDSALSHPSKRFSLCTPKKVAKTAPNLISQTVTKVRVPLGTSALQNIATLPALAVKDMNTTFDLSEEAWLMSGIDKTVTCGSSDYPGWENVGVPQIDCTFVKSSEVPVFTTNGLSERVPNTASVNTSTKSYPHRRRRSMSSSSSRVGNGTASQSRIGRLQFSTAKKLQRPQTITENISCSPRGQSTKKTGRVTLASGRSLGGAPVTRIMQLAAAKS
ncbi:PREDICTED: kinesin-like protein KIF18B [Nanorana parkeri]|uniref:kinesin-like protein KIF18B n=1 Tax=Nanorana parkeri TaxID=125878 RepID=UPI0008544D51|nr:PREDICTED: kinesin-like protein KIF18B [Nanorana parkeri]